MGSLSDYLDNLEPLLASVSRQFAFDGAANEVAVIVAATPKIEETSYDNWNGGTYGYTLTLEVPAHVYAQIKQSLTQLEKAIASKIDEFLRGSSNQVLNGVVIAPEVVGDDRWRDKARTWLAGDGVTNQGRVRSDNIAPHRLDGLLFRSKPEMLLYEALKSLGIPFAPLPVFLRGGKQYRRIEPDFVVVKQGIVLQVEVDGDTVHTESPADAHARSAMLAHEGVYVERVKASECDTPERAAICAQTIMAAIDRYKASR
ncbi:hypothetical protein KTE91_11295 [Burkholderia multivorans]|uniref:hypothetical protein n=1 Tax=Burkholderia multivorans TaxID=87883 RepID=UPI001C229F79|nr:hypothetical protein [Burkholderia multivorans]MBU9435689.1 hypothetical protein [Burkholderia multivorans]